MKKTIAVIALLLFVYVSSAAAWWSVPYVNFKLENSTHYLLTSDARTLAGSDYPDVTVKFGGAISNWTSGGTDDARAHNQDSETLQTLNKLLNGGPIADWWRKAKIKYSQDRNFNSGDWSAYYYVALMMHLIEDQAVPAHAYNIKHGSLGYMDNLEQLANSNYNPNITGIVTAISPISNYDDSITATRARTLSNDPNSYWKAYWQYGTTCPGVIGYNSVYGGPPITAEGTENSGYYGCPSDVFPALWITAGDNERNLTKDLLGQAVGYTAGALIYVSKNLPPLVQDLDITPSADAVPVIDTQYGNHISFHVQENRTQNVKLFITVDSPTGEPIISPEYGSGKAEPLSPGSVLPWEKTFTITWDGKLASGAYATNGEHTLYVRVQDDDGNFSPEITHPFSLHRLVLDSGYVDPPSGSSTTDFYYYVYYNDPDGSSPATANVYIDGTPHAMTLYSGATSDGAYVFGPIKLSAATHSYFFSFTAGNGGSASLPYSGTSPGPVITAGNYMLTVSKTGDGIGLISGVGINCGSDCQEVFPASTPVTLTAAAGTDSFFSGWSGGCNVTSPSCTINANADVTVSANFVKNISSSWAQYIPDIDINSVNAIHQTPEGGFVILSSGTQGAVTLKLFQNGGIDWQKSYANSGYLYYDSNTAISQTPNGKYIFTGTDSGNSKGLLVMVNGRGDIIEWQKRYVAVYDNSYYYYPLLNGLQQTADGGYIVAGSLRDARLWSRPWLLKLDVSKNVQASIQLSSLDSFGYHGIHGQINDIQPASGGGFIATGWIQPPNDNKYYLLILKLDASGNVVWKNSYGMEGNVDLMGQAVLQTSDGGYIVTGKTDWSFFQAVAIKFRADGSIQWFNTYPSSDYSVAGSIAEAADGYMLTGKGNPYNGNRVNWIMKLDKEYGQIISQKSLGLSLDDDQFPLKRTADGEFIAAVRGIGPNGSGWGVWIYKLDKNGNIGDSCSAVGTSNLTAVSRQISTTYSDMIPTAVRDGSTIYAINAEDGSAYVTPSNLTSTTICNSAPPNIAVSQTALNFGHVNIGSSTTQTITISNIGLGDLHINSIDKSGTNASEFIESNNCSSGIAPGGSCSISISFAPTALGQKNAVISISSDDPDQPTQTVSLSGTSGYILSIAKSGTGSGIVTDLVGVSYGNGSSTAFNEGTLITLTATSDANSTFAGWTGTACSGTLACTVTMNADTTVTAQFNLVPPVADFEASYTSGVFPLTVAFTDLSTGNPTSWTWNFGDGTTSTQQNPTHTYSSMGDYTVTLTVTNALGSSKASSESKSNYITVTNYITYTITATAGAGGTISPSGSVVAILGSSRTFSITSGAGYHIADVLVDGMSIGQSIGQAASFTLSNISSNHTIEARFAATTYTVTASPSASAGLGGNISPAGTLTYNYGDSQTFTISPDTANGYYVADVLVDGKSVGAVTQYPLNNITANHTITAIFSNASSHVIRASVGSGGSITPYGDKSVNLYTSQTFTIIPNDGYHVIDVLVDGASVGRVTTYTFSNVTSDHSISASFSNTYTLTILKSGDNAGTVTSDIGGIDCGANCTAAYAPGTMVTLTATPDANSTFTGWSGACTGTDKTCTVTMDADKIINAIFGKMAGWSKIYGNSTNNWVKSTQQTSDGGFVMAGTSGGYKNTLDAWVTKIDKMGNIEWQKTYDEGSSSTGNWDIGYSIKQTSDGGYILAASTSPTGYNGGASGVWILKLNSNGDIRNQKTFTGSGKMFGVTNEEVPFSIQETSDGGYVVAGYTQSTDQQGRNGWILKLDSSLSVVWQNTYGNLYEQQAESIRQTSDHGYIVAGSGFGFVGTGNAAWVFKLDQNGAIQWQKAYGGNNNSYANSVELTSDGGYIVAGYTDSFGAGSNDGWVLKLDVNGNIEWQKTYGGSNSDFFKSIRKAKDGGYIVVGMSVISGWGDIWILKLDSNGNILWQKYYSPGIANDVWETSDGGYIVAADIYTISGENDVLLLKIDGNGSVNDGCSPENISNVMVSSPDDVMQIDIAGRGEDINVVTSTTAAIKSSISIVPIAACTRPDMSISPAFLDFGSVNIGSSGTKTLTVTNTGTGPLPVSLVINSIDFTGTNAGEFSQINNCSSVSKGSSCTINVTFLSIYPGLKNAALVISSNGSDTPTLSVPITAFGGRKLTVAKTGNATGSVTSSPAGINCGPNCVAGFTQGSQITLTAVPDTNKIIFSGWSGGGCSGTGLCSITLNADTSVSAEFNYLPTADFTSSEAAGNIPLFQVNFTNNSSHYTSLLWNSGDGTTSTEVNPSHTYMTVGTYTVSLTASNPYGTDTKTVIITVLPCPDSPVRINRGSGTTLLNYSSLQAAYNDAIDQDVIEALDVNFIEDLDLHRPIDLSIRGGFACGYAQQIGNSSIEGQVRVSDGIVRAGNLNIVKSTPGNTYDIVALANSGGTVTPAGTVLVAQGNDMTFTIAPNPNYSILDVLVDGQSVGAVNTYMFTNVTANHRIEAIFSAM